MPKFRVNYSKDQEIGPMIVEYDDESRKGQIIKEYGPVTNFELTDNLDLIIGEHKMSISDADDFWIIVSILSKDAKNYGPIPKIRKLPERREDD